MGRLNEAVEAWLVHHLFQETRRSQQSTAGRKPIMTPILEIISRLAYTTKPQILFVHWGFGAKLVHVWPAKMASLLGLPCLYLLHRHKA